MGDGWFVLVTGGHGGLVPLGGWQGSRKCGLSSRALGEALAGAKQSHPWRGWTGVGWAGGRATQPYPLGGSEGLLAWRCRDVLCCLLSHRRWAQREGAWQADVVWGPGRAGGE